LIGDQRHRNNIATGQLLNRHAYPHYVFYFFTTAQKKLNCQRTNGTFGFAPTHNADPSAKPKEPFFSNTRFST